MQIKKACKLPIVLLVLLSSVHFCLTANAQDSLQEVINTELAFAQLAADQETRVAFLAYMSENSLLEKQGKLVKGRSVYLNAPPDTTGKLIWFPTIAAVSASGDLGYTSGPYQYQVKGKAVAFGNFATVWEKQAEKKWTFVIDLGNSHKPIKNQNLEKTVDRISPAKVKNVKTDLLQLDHNLNTQLQQGSPIIYLKILHPAARILRTGKPPYIIPKEKETLFAQKATIKFMPEGARTSSANDLGVVYGTCTLADPNTTEPQTGVYMHVWRKDAQKGWQLLHESINLVAKK